MRLNRLQVRGLRNLSNVSLELDPQINLIYGRNGSGKTSLLESVYYLGTTRTFRGTQIDPLIQRGNNECLVTGIVNTGKRDIQLGVQRTDQSRLIRVDGESQKQSSLLAHFLPSLVLGPSTVDLLIGSPNLRRSFLNWGVFHVKQEFAVLWQSGQRVLRQRNAVLRDSGRDQELDIWTEKFIEVAEKIDLLRQDYFDRFLPEFTETYRFLMGLEGVKCQYRRGWDGSLRDALQSQLTQDRQRKFTQRGFQRADLSMTIEGKPVSQICSRGELKLLSWAMVIAQGSILEQSAPIYLVDDLVAELDHDHQVAIANLLLKRKGQVLITGTDPDRLKGLWGEVSRKMFHVEQGVITEVE